LLLDCGGGTVDVPKATSDWLVEPQRYYLPTQTVCSPIYLVPPRAFLLDEDLSIRIAGEDLELNKHYKIEYHEKWVCLCIVLDMQTLPSLILSDPDPLEMKYAQQQPIAKPRHKFVEHYFPVLLKRGEKAISVAPKICLVTPNLL